MLGESALGPHYDHGYDRPGHCRAWVMLNAAGLRWGLLLPLLLAGLVLASMPGAQEQPSSQPAPQPANPAPPANTPEEAAYYAKLAEYRGLRAAYDTEASAYWELVTETRKARRKRRAEGRAIGLGDYVLQQPPLYGGPPEPVPPPALVRPRPPADPVPLPVVADFLAQAKAQFDFTPERAASEADYKRAYAEAALAAGIDKDLAIRVYGFEAGGNGRHDVQAGLETSGPKRRAISTALGYNQLLVTNSIGLLAEGGGNVIAAIRDRLGGATPERRARIEAKMAALRRMIRFTHTVPKAWSLHEKLARTPKGLGVHALNLDIDAGPLLQARKLADSVTFARRKGHRQRLTAAELEMMNLMGDGSGFDVVSMPAPMREKVPTANMFQRGGYDRNPVVRRHNTVASLLAATDAKMDQQAALPGAREMAAAFDAVAARPRGAANDAGR